MVDDREARMAHRRKFEVARIYYYKPSFLAMVKVLNAEENMLVLICNVVTFEIDKLVGLVGIVSLEPEQRQKKIAPGFEIRMGIFDPSICLHRLH